MKKTITLIILNIYLLFTPVLFTLSATDIYDVNIIFENEGTQKCKIKSLNFSSLEGWQANTVSETHEDTEKIIRILKVQPASKIIALPDPQSEKKILNWQKNINNVNLFYRSLIVEREEDLIGMIEIDTMPRGVTLYISQQGLLDFHKESLGLLREDPKDSTNISYFGKYRPQKDGKSSMVRMSLMLMPEFLQDSLLIKDIIEGSSVVLKMLVDFKYPLHSHINDRVQGIPKFIISYTLLEDEMKFAYHQAGFTLEENEIFKYYWPEECHSQLPKNPAIALKEISKIEDNKYNVKTKNIISDLKLTV